MFKIYGIDNGYWQITYKIKNGENQHIYYCLQDEGENYGGVLLYRMTSDGEPSHECKMNNDNFSKFEIPSGDSNIEKVVRNFLNEKEKQYETHYPRAN